MLIPWDMHILLTRALHHHLKVPVYLLTTGMDPRDMAHGYQTTGTFIVLNIFVTWKMIKGLFILNPGSKIIGHFLLTRRWILGSTIWILCISLMPGREI